MSVMVRPTSQPSGNGASSLSMRSVLVRIPFVSLLHVFLVGSVHGAVSNNGVFNSFSSNRHLVETVQNSEIYKDSSRCSVDWSLVGLDVIQPVTAAYSWTFSTFPQDHVDCCGPRELTVCADGFEKIDLSNQGPCMQDEMACQFFGGCTKFECRLSLGGESAVVGEIVEVETEVEQSNLLLAPSCSSLTSVNTTSSFAFQITLSDPSKLRVGLPLQYHPEGFEFLVDWGDGSQIDCVTSHQDAKASHAYSKVGTYEVLLNGRLSSWGKYVFFFFNGIWVIPVKRQALVS